jgi:hypothetical protein
LVLEMAQDLAAGDVDATLFSIVGTAVAVAIRNDSGAVAADNPEYTGTGLIRSYPPIGAAIGEKATTRVEIVPASALSRATS